MNYQKIIKVFGLLIIGLTTFVWMWKGYEIFWKASVIALLWFIVAFNNYYEGEK